ncbi:Retinol dehydrogenase 12 isoform 1 [Schistosoma japonicum]|uniref:Retinol dehydrogenase 12 isoform 1 n=1 Tax=Schistosoma japonicum TaxID=6182 RepID=A0A4Z2DC69_SCHJA|nr:Retinol dehydrogenase 12 isoform 1 [Schistosoma japonicum]
MVKLLLLRDAITGIGLETVDELARRGARVIMACRDLEKCKSARLEILTRTHSENPLLCSFRVEPDQLICEELDLESPKSIREFANRIISKEKFVPILINNAGADFPEKIYDEHGIEKHLKVNHLGHFLLTKLLKPCLRTSDGEPCRIIILSSLSHWFAKLTPNSRYLSGTGSGYSISKLLNVIHAREISKRWFVDGIVAVSVHPGLVRTSIFRSVKWKHVSCCLDYFIYAECISDYPVYLFPMCTGYSHGCELSTMWDDPGTSTYVMSFTWLVTH